MAGENTMKKLMFVLVVLALLATPTVALAGDGGSETGHYSWGFFHWVQDYYGWGPACYYRQNVRVIYDATNTWTYTVKEGNVRETLVQNGTAKIYDMGGNLLDERAFHVTERFFDAGTDVAIRHDYGTSVWYEASHNWWNSNLEEYHGSAGLLLACTALTRRRTVDAETKQRVKGSSVCAEMHKVLILMGAID